MKIIRRDTREELEDIILYLTRDEARQLRGYANDVATGGASNHYHLSSDDYTREVTLVLEEPVAEPPNPAPAP